MPKRTKRAELVIKAGRFTEALKIDSPWDPARAKLNSTLFSVYMADETNERARVAEFREVVEKMMNGIPF